MRAARSQLLSSWTTWLCHRAAAVQPDDPTSRTSSSSGRASAELHPEVESWYLAICESEPETADLIEDAVDQLAQEGPTAGRPLVDRVKGSRYQNMKELRPPSAGRTEIRMLFAFDPARAAIFLVAGDKSGQWESWYRAAVPLADERFAEHLTSLKNKEVRR